MRVIQVAMLAALVVLGMWTLATLSMFERASRPDGPWVEDEYAHTWDTWDKR